MSRIIKHLTIFLCVIAFSSHALGDVAIEAEDANLFGVSIETGRGASGDAYVDFKNPSGHYIEFSITVDTPGDYTLQTTYQLGGSSPRPLLLTVIGTPTEIPFNLPATGSWQS